MQQMYSCPNCGSPLNYGAQFCGNCGAPVNWPTQQQMQPPPPQQPPAPPPGYQQQPPSGYQQPPQYQQPWNYQQMPPQQQYVYGYGWQQPQKQGSSTWIILFAVFACIFLLAGAYFVWSGGDLSFLGGNKSSDTTTPSTQDETTAANEQEEEEEEEEDQEIKIVNVEDLVSDYLADAEAADTKYNGKIYTITGKVASSDLTGWVVINSDGDLNTVGAKCVFSAGNTSKISTLNPGDTITVIGEIGEFDVDIIVNNCVFSS